MTANILVRSSRGLCNGGSIPLGYTKHPENKSDPEHAETIRTVFTTYLKMGSLSSTARWLNENVRKLILQKFVRRVEIGPDKVKIYWNVDKEFYFNEVSQAKACGSSSKMGLLKFSGNVGSNSFTIGARNRTSELRFY